MPALIAVVLALFSSGIAFEIAAPPHSANRAHLQQTLTHAGSAIGAVGNSINDVLYSLNGDAPAKASANFAQSPSAPSRSAASTARTGIDSFHSGFSQNQNPAPAPQNSKQHHDTTALAATTNSSARIGHVLGASTVGPTVYVPAPQSNSVSPIDLVNLKSALEAELDAKLAALTTPAPFPQQVAGGGVPAPWGAPPPALSRIDQLTNTIETTPTINTPTISGGSISNASVSATTLSAGTTNLGSTTASTLNVSGASVLSGNLNIGGTLTANSLSVASVSSGGAVSAPYFSATDTTATSTFSGGISGAFVHFTSGLIDTLTTSVANIVGLTATNATFTNSTSTTSFADTAAASAARFGATATSSFSSAGALTLATPLAASSGGTTIANPSAAGILLGSYAGGSWQQLATSTLGLLTTNVGEGSNLYYTDTRVSSYISGSSTVPHIGGSAYGDLLSWTGSAWATRATSTLALNTDNLVEGPSNLFWANTRFDNRLSATTTLPNITTLANLGSVGTLTSGSIGSGFGAINIGGNALTAGAGSLVSISVSGTSQFANSVNFFGLTSFGATATTTISTAGTITTPSIIATNAAAFSASFGAAATSTFSSTGALSLAGGLTLSGNPNGPLQANAGLVSATTSMGALYGGTGQTSVATGDLLYGSATNAWSKLGIGTGGYVLGISNGLPTWVATSTLSTLSGTLGVASGGTGTTTWQTGSIPFYNGSNFTENNSKLVWDSTNNRLGLGTTTPAGALDVLVDSGGVIFRRYGGIPNIQFLRAQGSVQSPTIVLNGGNLGANLFSGYDGSAYQTAAEILAQVDGTPGSANMPGRLMFFTTPSGSATQLERMRIDNAGNVGVGTTSPGSLLSLNNIANFTTATSTFYSSGGLNLAGGCFAISGNCLSLTSLGGTLGIGSGGTNATSLGSHMLLAVNGTSVVASSTPTAAAYLATSTTATSTFAGGFSAASSLYVLQNGNVGIGTASPTTVNSYAVPLLELSAASLVPELGINYTASGGRQFALRSDTTSGNGIFAFVDETANAYRGVFDKNGNFGINTLTPAEKFNVNGNIRADGSAPYLDLYSTSWANHTYISNNQTTTGSNGGNYLALTNPSSKGFAFVQGSTNVLLVDTNGNLGIAQTSPTYKLDVTGLGHFTGLVDAANFVATSSSATTTLAGMLAVGSNALNVLSNGNVGIGTASPNLSRASGGLNISGPYSGLAIQSTASGVARKWELVANYSGINPFFEIYDDTASASRLAISTAGNIGIGTISPSLSRASNGLNISGDSSGLAVQSTGVTGKWEILANYDSGNRFLEFYDDTAGASRMVLDKNGNVGIASTTPWRTLSLTGTVGFDGLTGSTGAGSLCLDSNKQVVYNSGSDNCLSSTRATKHDITDLDLDSLSLVDQLQPVSFVYNQGDGRTRYGFIAEDTAAVDAHLATYDASSTVSGIDDRSIIAILVAAVKDLASKLSQTAHLIIATLTAHLVEGDQVHAKEELCVGATCVTEDQFKAMLAGSAAAGAPQQHDGNEAPSGSSASPQADADTASSTTPENDNQPPTITINGNNPAQVNVGATYADLGATIMGPTADLNLGIHTFVDGSLKDAVTIDTSTAATHTIEYVVTDQNGLTATSTRTVIVSPPPNYNASATSTPTAATSTLPVAPPANDNQTATTTATAI